MSNESIITAINLSVISFVVLVYLALAMEISEPSRSETLDDCTHGCPLRSSSHRRVGGLAECLYSEGRLIETRLSGPDRGFSQICELSYKFGGGEEHVVRSYIVTH